MKTSETTFTKSILITATTLLLIFGVLYLFFRLLQPFVLIFLTAFILSICLNPLHEYLNTKARFGKTASAIIAVLLLFIVVSAPLTIFIALLTGEVAGILEYISVNAGIKNQLIETLLGLFDRFGLSTKIISLEMEKYVVSSLRFLSTSLTGIISGTAGLLLNTLLTISVTIYFLAYKKTIALYIYDIIPLPKADTDRLVERAVEVIGAVLRGNLVIVAIQAILGGVGFAISGLTPSLLLAMLYGLASLIPVVGIAIIWVPGAAYLILSGNLMGGLGIAAWCIMSNLLLDNVIGPKILGSQARLHPLFILFGVLGGISMFGLIGIVLGPTVIAVSFIAIDIYRQLLKR